MKKTDNDRLYFTLAKRHKLPPEVKEAYKAAKKLKNQKKAEARAAWKAKRRRSSAQGGSAVELSPAAPPLESPTVDAPPREPSERI